MLFQLADRRQGHLLFLLTVGALLKTHVLVRPMLGVEVPAVGAVFQAWYQIFALAHDACQRSQRSFQASQYWRLPPPPASSAPPVPKQGSVVPTLLAGVVVVGHHGVGEFGSPP